MSILVLETYSPTQHQRVVSPEELDEVFHGLDRAEPATLSCEDHDNDRSLIVSFDGDYAFAEYLYDNTSYVLDVSDKEETVGICIDGIDVIERLKSNVVSRQQGLELVRRALADMAGAFSSFHWVPDNG
ncbi:MAG TPA: hypothetical protein VHJ17_25875 [Thermomonospora sp.]|nr:hypothetical protein [Thermomonospora sp.]